MKRLSTLLLILCWGLNSFTQTKYYISGKVKNVKGENIEAATVFLNGSKQVTKTDSSGVFVFNQVLPGTFQLVVNMLGYSSVKQNVVVQDKNAVLNITMPEKTNILSEVVIGNGSQRAEHLKIFIKNFLGESKNAKSCSILNPDLLDFSTRQTLLEATTDDFLIIENKSLGYRIRYLLRNFRFNKGTGITSYDGESIFENMDGSEQQQAQWKLNRKTAYDGSFMHYLRSVYANTLRKEGFLTYDVMNNIQPLQLNPNPVDMEQFIYTVDSNFIEMRFKKRFYIVHEPKKAAKLDQVTDGESITKTMDPNGTVMRLFLDNAIVDQKGSYVDYKSFFIQGYWGKKRIGDQLPFEYQPGD